MMHPHHYAVVVCINDYPEFKTLSHARRDGEEFAAWLRDKEAGGGLPEDNVQLIPAKATSNGKNRALAVPTAKEVWEALDRFRLEIDQKIADDPDVFEQGRLYFFVSGHGIAPRPVDAALLMADAGRDYYDNNVSCQELVSYFELRQYFKEVVVFADCCRQMPNYESAAGRPPWGREKRIYGGVRKCWGYATDFDDAALEPTATMANGITDDERHGYFTRALLEGLRGNAVINGRVDSDALAAYVTGQVTKFTNGRQKSQIVASEKVVFRECVTTPRYQATIRFPKGVTQRVVLTRGLTDVIAQHVPDGTPWVVELVDDLYRVRPEKQSTSKPFAGGGLFAVEGADVDVVL